MSEKTRNSLMLKATESYVEKIQNFADEMNVEFTPYQKNCVVNAIRTINQMITGKGYSWQSFAVDNIITVLQQTAFLELNPSATPHECFFIVRKNYTKVNGKRTEIAPTLEFGIEGAGNDTILVRFGRDVKEIKSYIVYEGDVFEQGYMDGWDMTLPKYTPQFKSRKPLMAVYLIKKTNGEIDIQYADTQDVKKSLLANARQNGADEKLLRQLNKIDLYDLLEDEKWLDHKIVKTYGTKSYSTPLFNPSYTSAISMYNMIERKLRNHATRKYPKNFNVKEVSRLYEDSFEEKYDEKGAVINAEERLEIANNEMADKAGKEEFMPAKDDRPEFEVKPEVVVEEKVVEEKTGVELQKDIEYVKNVEHSEKLYEEHREEVGNSPVGKPKEEPVQEEKPVVNDNASDPGWDE